VSKDCENGHSLMCEETHTSVEKSFWQKLNFVEAMKMRFHLFICKNCSAYEKDSKVLHRLLCCLKAKEKKASLNAEEKEALKKAIVK
jgi:hypothetical protein